MKNPNGKKFNVEMYQKQNGDKPVEVFLKSLDKKMRSKVARLIELLSKEGNNLREPFSKPIGNGVFELRYQNKQ